MVGGGVTVRDFVDSKDTDAELVGCGVSERDDVYRILVTVTAIVVEGVGRVAVAVSRNADSLADTVSVTAGFEPVGLELTDAVLVTFTVDDGVMDAGIDRAERLRDGVILLAVTDAVSVVVRVGVGTFSVMVVRIVSVTSVGEPDSVTSLLSVTVCVAVPTLTDLLAASVAMDFDAL